MATPGEIGWLHRALRHEFAAARQFTLQAVVLARLGEAAFAAEAEQAAIEELSHAQRFARALAEAGASWREGAGPVLPVGDSLEGVLRHAIETEAEAVRLYAAASRACALPGLRRLFEAVGAEEAGHLAQLSQRQRAS